MPAVELDRAPNVLARYYTGRAVRERIFEYCGGHGTDAGTFSALELAGYGGTRWLQEPEGAGVRFPLRALSTLMAQGADVCRSMADSGGTLLLLDLDYNDPADPEDPYRRPGVCFGRLEPVHQAVVAAFARRGVSPLVLMTGRGYHYVVRAPEAGALHRGLVEMGARAERLPYHYERLTALGRMALDMEHAHEAAGRLLEQLAHDVLREAGPQAAVPVLLADVPPPGGGAFICLDLSAYGDPLMSRHARCAFSSNQKAFITRAAPEHPFVLVLPRGGEPYAELLEARQDPQRAARIARSTSVRIPDVQDESDWLATYRTSGLAFFHAEFDADFPRDEGQGAPGGDGLNEDALPPCIGLPLRFPNPRLLQPVHLRTISLGLWSLGWSPRSVAGLVRSRYEEDHGWGSLWQRYDPGSRADFYVRLFCGAAAEGLEDRHFTCAIQAERGLCSFEWCGYDRGALFQGLRHKRVRDVHA